MALEEEAGRILKFEYRNIFWKMKSCFKNCQSEGGVQYRFKNTKIIIIGVAGKKFQWPESNIVATHGSSSTT